MFLRKHYFLKFTAQQQSFDKRHTTNGSEDFNN